MKPLWDDRYTPADAEIIKRKARKMIGNFGYSRSDADDIEQELAMHAFRQTGKHDPARGTREKFVEKMARNKILNLIEAKTAAKRDDRRNISIDDASDYAVLDGHVAPEVIDVRLDVGAIINSMPAELRQIAMLRMDMNERDIERELGLTRAQVRTRMQHIAAYFSNTSLNPEKHNHAEYRSGRNR